MGDSNHILNIISASTEIALELKNSQLIIKHQ